MIISSPYSRKSGFTLLEILLVVFLISLSSLMVFFTLPNSTSDDLAESHALSFYYRFLLLSEEGSISGQDFGIRVDEPNRHYELMVLTSEGWRVKEAERRMTSKVELESSLDIKLLLLDGVWGDLARSMDDDTLFDEDMFLTEDEKANDPPQIFVLSNGEYIPFILAFYPSGSDIEELSLSDVDMAWRVVVSDAGSIKVLAAGESDDE